MTATSLLGRQRERAALSRLLFDVRSAAAAPWSFGASLASGRRRCLRICAHELMTSC